MANPAACAIQATSSNYNDGRVNISPGCAVASGRQITVSAVNNQPLPSGAILELSLDGVINSNSEEPTGAFRFQTFYSAAELTEEVDTHNTLTLTSAAAAITSVTLTADSLQVLASTRYVLEYTVRSSFPANSHLLLTLPEEIQLGSPSYSYSYTDIASGVPTASANIVPVEVSTAPTVLRFNGLSALTLASGSVIELVLDGVINPNSFKPTSSFSIAVRNANGFLVETIGTGVSIECNVYSSFPVMFESLLAPTNGQLVAFTVDFTSIRDMPAGYYFEVVIEDTADIDTQRYLTGSIGSCDLTYVNAGTTETISNTCQKLASNSLRVTLGGAISPGLSYQLAVKALQLSRTKLTPAAITITSFTQDDFGISQNSPAAEQNTEFNSIPSIQLSILTAPSKLNELQSFTLQVTVANLLQTGDYLQLEIPTLYLFVGTLLTLAGGEDLAAIKAQSLCALSDPYFCSHVAGNPNTLLVQEVASNTVADTQVVALTIKDGLYRSPITFAFTSSTFTARTFSASGQQMDATTDPPTDLTEAVFALTCSANNCGECFTNGSCSSCYVPGTGYTPGVDYDGY